MLGIGGFFVYLVILAPVLDPVSTLVPFLLSNPREKKSKTLKTRVFGEKKKKKKKKKKNAKRERK